MTPLIRLPRRASGRALRFAICTFSLSLVFVLPAAAQMDIDEVIMSAEPSYVDGGFVEFAVDPVVLGTQIAAVTMTTQSGIVVNLVEVLEDEFRCDDAVVFGAPCEDLIDISDLASIGSLTFDISGESGESDTIVVPAGDWIAGNAQPGFPMIVSPAVGVMTIPPGDLFEWNAASAWVDLIITRMLDVDASTEIDDAVFFGGTQTSWAPAGILPSTVYSFEISFVAIPFAQDARITQGGDGYAYTSAFQANNRKFVPEPTGAWVWLASAATIMFMAFARGRRHAPILR